MKRQKIIFDVKRRQRKKALCVEFTARSLASSAREKRHTAASLKLFHSLDGRRKKKWEVKAKYENSAHTLSRKKIELNFFFFLRRTETFSNAHALRAVSAALSRILLQHAQLVPIRSIKLFFFWVSRIDRDKRLVRTATKQENESTAVRT